MPSDAQNTRRPRTEHWVAPLAETPLQEVDAADTTGTPRSLWAEAGRSLIRNPVFVISALLILFVLFVAAFPQVFSGQDPRYGDLSLANQKPGAEHPFGTSRQGYDILARTVWGARTSVVIGFFAMLGSTLIGGTIGALAGYLGGWFDEVVSRITDIFFAVPLILGAIVVATRLGEMNLWTVVAVLSVFGWTNIARIMRGAVISTKSQDYVTSSVALGASSPAVLLKHVIPNAIAPVIVTATVNLGVFIVA